MNWNDPRAAELGDGWSVGPCEGDAPLVCFSYGGQVQGVAEVASFPAGTNSTVSDVLARGGTEHEALAAHAAEHLASMRADRLKGCGADYAFVADVPRAMTADGVPAVKTAFIGGDPGSAPTERVVRWVGLRDGGIVSLVLHATDEGACAPGLGGDMSTADLAGVEPLIDAAFAVSPLPAGVAA